MRAQSHARAVVPALTSAVLTGLTVFLPGVFGISPAGGATPPTPPAARLVSGVVPPSAVRLGPNSDVQTVVDAYPTGSTFLLTTGSYLGFSVVPKANDSFYAQPGVVLDGENRLPSAFRVPSASSVNGVQIVGAGGKSPLVVQDYGTKSHSQIAAVQTSSQGSLGPVYSSGWRLQWVQVTNNLARGITLSNEMLVIGCTVSSNGRLGIGGGGDGVTIAYDNVDDNGVSVAQRGWEAGGIKTVADSVLIEHNTISGNGAPAIWTDVGATGIAITDNHLSSNQLGVQIEISRNVSITANVIMGSQRQAVLVVGSDGVAVTGNTINDNFRGIIVGGAKRVGPDAIHLNNIHVSHNAVVYSGASGLHQPVPSGTKISFDWDHYVGSRFQWEGQRVSFAALQAMGQERHGTSQ